MSESNQENEAMERQQAAPFSSQPEQMMGEPMPKSTRGGRYTTWNGAKYRLPDPRHKSPFLAGAMSIVPGLGQIYVGYYTRGFINPLVVGGIFSLLFSMESNHPNSPPFYLPICIIFLIFFWLYNIIDAWRRATMYNLALEGIENIQLPDDLGGSKLGGSTFGGVVLLIVGGTALMVTRFGLPREVIEQWWPLAPMAFGAYLIYRDHQDRHPE